MVSHDVLLVVSSVLYCVFSRCIRAFSLRTRAASIDRALRSDPVSVRLAGAQQVDALRRAGKVRG